VVKFINSRPTVGYLIDWSERDYQVYLRDGVLDAAEEADANLICFAGGALRSTNFFEAQRNVLYDLVSEHNVDGIIVMSASIGHWVKPDDIRDFCYKFKNIPMVSIAMYVKGVPTIMVDQEIGMRALLNHLIEDHQYKRIAVITGPESNPEAIQRFNIYRNSLEAHNIAFDSDLVVEGDFTSNSGIAAIQTLIDKRRAQFNVVIALNDEMAIGAMSELQRRNIHIPGKVAVVGFDDVKVAKYYSPPITTVRQPLYEQGKKAFQTLLARIHGEEVPERIYLNSELKIRESCGCMGEGIVHVRTKGIKALSGDFEKVTADEEPKIIALVEKAISEILPNVPALNSHDFARDIVESFRINLTANESEHYIRTFNEIIYEVLRVRDDTDDLNHWQYVISVHRKAMLPCLNERVYYLRAEELWQQARVMIGEFILRKETHKRLTTEVETQRIRDLNQELNLHIISEELLKVISIYLPQIGIPSAFISLYNDVKIPGETSRLILAYDEKGYVELDSEGRVFKTIDLIPPEIMPHDRRFVYIVEAFFHGQNHLGFGLFEMGPKEGVIYELIRLRMSGSLRGAFLLKQVKDQAHCLEEQVKERTRDLIRINEMLEQEIVERKRIESALIRSNDDLQQFAYIASHDLQEPLRMIAGYVGLLERRYKDKLDSNANEFIEFVVDGAKRMQKMINDLLTYSRVNTRPCNLEKIDSAVIVNQAITNLRAVIEEKRAKILLANLPIVSVDFSQLTQVFQNLIGNAIKFQKAGELPVVEISAVLDGSDWKFSIKDNGIGIDPEYNDKIFMMFRRLHGRDEYPGSGIGLTICKKIIERHDGRIWVESEAGSGSAFYFTIPKRGE
jgi:DNA-binding LacI/PurR family transcriptional regulator/signal transduction histidine kinase